MTHAPAVDASRERRPLRLLLVSHSLSGGGAERFAATLAAHLDREKFAPAIAVATDRATYRVPDDVRVTRLGYRGLVTLPRTIARLRRTIAAERPDVVLSNVLSTNCLTGAALTGLGGGSPGGPGPAWVARIGNAPEHGDPPLHALWARRLYPRAARVITNSRGLARAFVRYYPGVPERLVESVANPTDFDRLDELAAAPPPAVSEGRGPGERSRPVRVVWVGRLEPQKRPDLAIEVMMRVRRDLAGAHDVRLSLCGKGPLRSRLERRIAEAALGEAVELTGFLNNPFPMMRAADLFLSTSDFEGLPNALIEAQGLGLPAVATRCPYGPDEVVDDGETGLLAAPGDADALAAAVAALAADRERRERFGRAAAERARERFGLASVVPRWEAILEQAAGCRVSGGSGEEEGA